MTKARPSCRYCRHNDDGMCRRYPPTTVSVNTKDAWGNDRQEIQWHQPAVIEKDWCGEFKFDRIKFAEAVLT